MNLWKPWLFFLSVTWCNTLFGHKMWKNKWFLVLDPWKAWDFFFPWLIFLSVKLILATSEKIIGCQCTSKCLGKKKICFPSEVFKPCTNIPLGIWLVYSYEKSAYTRTCNSTLTSSDPLVCVTHRGVNWANRPGFIINERHPYWPRDQ